MFLNCRNWGATGKVEHIVLVNTDEGNCVDDGIDNDTGSWNSGEEALEDSIEIRVSEAGSPPPTKGERELLLTPQWNCDCIYHPRSERKGIFSLSNLKETV